MSLTDSKAMNQWGLFSWYCASVAVTTLVVSFVSLSLGISVSCLLLLCFKFVTIQRKEEKPEEKFEEFWLELHIT